MTTLTTPTGRREAERIEQSLLARLGLGADANSEEIEDAHDRLVAFLETAPHELRTWVRTQIAAADEAYALLADTAALTIDAASPETPAPAPAPTSSAHVPTPPAARASTLGAAGAGRDRRAAVADDEDLPEELEETEGAGMPVRRPTPKAHRAATASAATVDRAPARKSGSRKLVARALIAATALLAVGAIAVAGYNLGAPSVPGVNGTPAPEASAASSVDQAQVAALMQKISANPKDTASLLALANLYFDAGDYTTAAQFMGQVVAVDPKNVDGLVGLGAAQFNTGDSVRAKENWEQAIAIDPKNQEAYFDLGFLYLNQNPPDMTNVKLNWNKVIEIDPTSALAKSVKTHLDAFASPSPAGSAPAASAAPSAAPAASPSPSGS